MDRTEDVVKRAALQKRKAVVLARLKHHQQQGLKIIGIDVQGKAKSIGQFSDYNDFIRVVEIRKDSRRNSAILPNH